MPAPTVLHIIFADHLTLGYGAGPYGAWAYGIGPYYHALPVQRITLVLSEAAMTTPNTTLDSSATLTDQNGAAITSVTSAALAVTYQDGSSAAPAVTNQGAGVYTATYNTKGPGLLTELWSFTDTGGSIASEQRSLVIAY